MRTLILLVLTLLATACTGIPPGHQVVKPFQLDRYLGTWNRRWPASITVSSAA